MKKIQITIFLLTGWLAASAQNTFPISGNVGIGTTSNLGRALTVNGGIDLFGEGSTDAGIFLYHPVENGIPATRWFFRVTNTNNNSYPYLTNRTPSGKVVIKTGSAAGGSESTHFTINGGDGVVNAFFENANLGIGTSNPRSNFVVNGANGEAWLNQHSHLVLNNKNNSTTSFWTMAPRSNGTMGIGYGTLTNNEFVDNSNDFISIISSTGYVGIGTSNPKSKFAVNGNIRATEVKVLADISVPDYVFESDYELRTLEEIREYITENKHLPEIPSAAEIGENGIDLGDMNMKLLKKIEELTLYQIELMERLENQQKQIAELARKIN